MNTNNISIFNHDQFGKIRVVDRNGRPWFVARDVCGSLGYAPTKLTQTLQAHCKGVTEAVIPSAGGAQTMKLVHESDVYRLVMRSKLPEAERFQDWVVEVVLPSIRRDGGYLHVTEADDDMTILLKAFNILKTANEKLQAQVEADAPKVAVADAYLSEGEPISMGDLAKKLGHEGIDIGQNRLFQFLRDKGVLIRRPGINFNMPTQAYASRGWFKIIQPPPSQIAKWRKQLRITPKGVLEISKRMHELFGADFN